MRNTDLEELRTVLQRVRAERFPHVDAKLVDAVLDAEAGSTEDETAAIRAVTEAVDSVIQVGAAE